MYLRLRNNYYNAYTDILYFQKALYRNDSLYFMACYEIIIFKPFILGKGTICTANLAYIFRECVCPCPVYSYFLQFLQV
jgi:hypothetical protein